MRSQPQQEWWPPNSQKISSRTPTANRESPLPSPLNKDLSARLGSGRSRGVSSARSTSSHIAIARRAQEEAVNKEISKLYRQVEQDVGFNMEDVYHGNEAQRIVEDKTAEARGAIPEHARILHDEVLHSKKSLAAQREETPDAKDMWRQNRNPGVKWWQNGDTATMNTEQKKNLNLHDISSAHPAYFMMRRKNIGLDYVEKPVYKTRSELLAQRKEALKPDASYDLDGDGVVGVREYYFAARMDKDVSGQLDSKEKLQGLKDLQENISSVMFVDNAGQRNARQAGNQYRIIQQDGKILLDQQ